MARAFEQSHAAYARKDGAAAKELSNEGKAHQSEMERLNSEASAWIFRGEYCILFLLPPCSVVHGTCDVSPSIENNQVRILLFLVKIPSMTYLVAFRAECRRRSIYTGFMSRRLSRTVITASLRHGREAIRRFALSSVRIILYLTQRATDRFVLFA